MRDGLASGRSVTELTLALKSKGYDPEWAASFVVDIEERFGGPVSEADEGDFAAGFVLGLVCALPALAGVLIGLAKPRTRRGIIRGAALSFVVAGLIRLCAYAVD